jgi:uncharacterized protein YjbI with pentapeptide repeats
MPRPFLSQPLPQDLRDQSFRRRNCVGWDFSGKDIRGCDFRNAELSNANFSRVVTGRSQKQNIQDMATIVTGALVGVFAGAVAFSIADIFAVGFACVITCVVTFAYTGKFTGIFAGAVTGAVTGAGATVIQRAIDSLNKGNIFEGSLLLIIAIVFLIIVLYSIRKGVGDFKNTTGTTFKDTNLRHVNFSRAILNNCQFTNADTHFANWSNVQGSRSTIDFTDLRMQLLTSLDGKNGKYSEIDLSDQHLAYVQFQHAKLEGADLTRSNLQGARLDYANLSNAKTGGTNLRGATLTGACIQNWTVNSDTQFDDLTCDYIYLTPDQDKQNRRPLSGNFEPGDFEKLVDKFADTLDFILRRGTDPSLFRQSLDQFKQDNPEARIRGIVELDVDRVLVQATVPEGSDKVEIYENFHHQLQLKEQEVKYLKGTIDDKDRMIDKFLNKPQSIVQVLQATNPTGTLMPYQQAGGDIITADNNQGVVGKDMMGVAGRDISGSLTLNLNTLRETEDPKSKDLADLIDQLKQAIEATDSELDDRHKKRAIKYLNNLTQLAKDKPEDFLKGAKDNLDDLADIADKGSKFATFAAKYFPTVMTAIDALRLWFGV